MKPTDVLAVQREIVDTCLDFQRNVNNWYPDLADQVKVGRWNYVMHKLARGEPYYVSADMVALVEAAWPSMPPSTLSKSDVPTEGGFLIYDVPLRGVDVGVVGLPDNRVIGYMWSHAAVLPEDGSGVVLLPIVRGPDGRPAPLYKKKTAPTVWPYGGLIQREVVTSAEPLRATWLMMAQKLSATTREHVDRAERRRCAKLNLPQEVNVVRVRKREQLAADNPEHRDIEWSHRWLVSGHWRQQPCGPGREDRRPTWIPGHVKGPDDKPLVIKDRVTAWVR